MEIKTKKLINRKEGRLSMSKKQSGQALTEFATMMSVFVPLFLMVPVLGKISDMNSTSIQASRYAAWERTIASPTDKSDAVLNDEVRSRLFGLTGHFNTTGETPNDSDQNHNPLWTDHKGDRLLTSSINDVDMQAVNGGLDGSLTSGFTNVINTIGSTLSKLSSSADWDLTSDGLYTATVNVNVASNNFGLDAGQDCSGTDSPAIFACITRHNVILADSWDSPSPNVTESRVKSFVPAAIFETLSSVTGIIGAIPVLKEWKKFDPGYVDPEVIPADRLGNY
jgi:hypothetical protein